MTVVRASEARTQLPAILNRVEAGEEVTITRHGRPVAVVLRPDALRTRRAEAAFTAAAGVRELLDRARVIPLSKAPGLAPGRADELVAELRADPDAG